MSAFPAAVLMEIMASTPAAAPCHCCVPLCGSCSLVRGPTVEVQQDGSNPLSSNIVRQDVHVGLVLLAQTIPQDLQQAVHGFLAAVCPCHTEHTCCCRLHTLYWHRT